MDEEDIQVSASSSTTSSANIPNQSGSQFLAAASRQLTPLIDCDSDNFIETTSKFQESNQYGNVVCANNTMNNLNEELSDPISHILFDGPTHRLDLSGSEIVAVELEEPMFKPFTDDMASPKVARTGPPKLSKRKNYIPKKCLGTSSLTHPFPSTSEAPLTTGYSASLDSGFLAIDLTTSNSTPISQEITPHEMDTASSIRATSLETRVHLEQSAFGSLYQVEWKRPSIYPSLQRFTTSSNTGSPNRRLTDSCRPGKPKETKTFKCNQCSDVFKFLRDLHQHTISTHRSYRCKNCGSRFTQRSNLQRHSLKHVGFKPYQCGICDKAYNRKDHLMRHMRRIHPGVDASKNIRVLLTSSQSLDYLNRLHLNNLNQKEESDEGKGSIIFGEVDDISTYSKSEISDSPSN